VVVRWEEANDAREVRRTTYAIDAQAIEEAFASLGGDASAGRAADAQQTRAATGGKQTRKAQQPLPDFKIPGLLDKDEDDR
jgi:hypothetical protein